MDIAVFDEHAAPFSAEVTLEAAETDALTTCALARLARILKCAESDARTRAAQLLTAREMETYLRESVMNRAGDRALAEACPPFVGEPKTEALTDFFEGAPFSFRITVHPVPAMDLDMETPIARRAKKRASARGGERTNAQGSEGCDEAAKASETPADESRPGPSDDEAAAREGDSPLPRDVEGRTDEEFVAETLRARLNGTVADALVDDAFSRKKEEFMAELAESGITYREYRIANRVKPQDVKDALADEAFDDLTRDIALDTVFMKQGLETTVEDETAVLADMAPGREASLRGELEATGKLWMLAQKTRRATALRWAMGHLLEK